MDRAIRNGLSHHIIHWLSDDAATQPEVAGGKASALARLGPHFRIPPGFLVAAGVALDTTAEDAVRHAYRRLGELVGEDAPRVAVRSSAVGEDGNMASFAGQLDTRLGVRGADAVVGAVRAVTASADSHRVSQYQAIRGQGGSPPITAVLVQALVLSDVSLVGFSIDPVQEDGRHMAVHATFGLGESLVSGLVNPDVFTVRRTDLRVVAAEVGDKAVMVVPAESGTRTVKVPRMMASRLSLDPAQVEEVARVMLALEERQGHPVDVEAAFVKGNLYLLQCRPITTVGREAGGHA